MSPSQHPSPAERRIRARGWRADSGRPSLDLVNTLQRRAGEPVELLRTPADLAAWLQAAGLATGHLPVGPQDLADARDLREAVDALVAAHLRGEPAPEDAITAVDARLAARPDAGARLRLDAGGHPALAPGGVPSLLGLVALDAARLLGTDERERLRVCEDAACSTRFVDRSNAGTRRWCSPRCSTRHHMRERRRDGRG